MARILVVDDEAPIRGSSRARWGETGTTSWARGTRWR